MNRQQLAPIASHNNFIDSASKQASTMSIAIPIMHKRIKRDNKRKSIERDIKSQNNNYGGKKKFHKYQVLRPLNLMPFS